MQLSRLNRPTQSADQRTSFRPYLVPNGPKLAPLGPENAYFGPKFNSFGHLQNFH